MQGVNYRRAMQTEATRLGLTGWVRNRDDGTVEALLCGSTEMIDLVLEWARRGPRFSRVEKVVAEDTEAADHDSFNVLPTT